MLPGRTRKECKAQWLKTQHIKVNKVTWSDKENKILTEVINKFGTNNWTEIAVEFNKVSAENSRTRKQCRDHWLNFLNPEVDRGKMTPQDELHLLCYWQQLGNRWVEIAKFMGRSENWVKNNWKKILKQEGLAEQKDVSKFIPGLIEKAMANVHNYINPNQIVPLVPINEEAKSVKQDEQMMCNEFEELDINMKEEVKHNKPKDVFNILEEPIYSEGLAEDDIDESASKLMDTEVQQFGGLIKSDFSFRDSNDS